MAPKKNKLTHPEFPAGLSQPALRALANGGYTTLAKLARATEADVAALHGMGPSGIALLRQALAEQQLSFAPARKTR